MLRIRSRKFRQVLLFGAAVLALVAISIPIFQYLPPMVNTLEPVKAAGAIQEPLVTIFRDDFESDRGWIRNPDGTDTTTVTWERNVTGKTTLDGISQQLASANVSNNALVMSRFRGASARNKDVAGGISSILSPEITLPPADTLTLSFNSYFVRSGKSSSGDFFRASIINYDGATPVLTVTGDDNAAADDWVLQSISLKPYAGQTIRILFEAVVATGGGQVEAAVDDVAVTSGEFIQPLALSSNLALNKPATGSTPCNSDEGPAKAVNGSVSGGNSDKFCSQAGTKFLRVDLGQSFNLTTFTVRHASAGGESTSFNTRNFNISVSTDGAVFTTVVNVTGNTQGVTTHTITARMARFVQLNVTQAEQTNNITARIYELEVFAELDAGVCSGTNVALRKVAISSPICREGEGPDKAVNGSVSGGLTDKLCTKIAPRFLEVDLGGSFNVTCFRLSHAGAGGESTAFNTRDFNIQLRPDGGSFTTVVNVTGNTQNVTNHMIAGTAARTARLNVTTPTSNLNGSARIYEFEVFGTPINDPTVCQNNPQPLQNPWREHWFEHNVDIRIASQNSDVVVYFDDDVPRGAETDWILPFATKVWQYTKRTYSCFGPDPRLISIHHQNKFGGGHPGVYFSPLHDFTNSTDIGVANWIESGNRHDLISHEVGHIVEGASNDVHESPAFPVWGDSKWIEFYQYDFYTNNGFPADAQRVFNTFTNTRDNFPRANTAWFRDWFFPLWRDNGGAQAMARFFKLLAENFPKTIQNHGGGNHQHYTRNMNLGEFIHFTSGAARTNLSGRATTAFGAGTQNWEVQFQAARQAFPAVTALY